ncbi:MAG: branched-chain amino acid ABC transporter permease [Rhodospirillaceae bacterium]|nr:branched-chain amino acid ABC transporter permease [Rhodospirillaceae bacterium]
MALTDPAFVAIQVLNAFQLASLLFLLSVGLSVVFGLMNFINLAHGTLYMVGAYVGYAVAQASGSFWLALVLAPVAVALLGAILHWLLLARLQAANPMKQVLATFGLIFMGLDAVRWVWGSQSHGLEAPAGLDGSVTLLGQTYPVYRLFVIAVGAAVAVGLYLVLERTRLGARVRAGVDDRDMAAALGIDIGRLFFGVFCLGCGLAGLAGVVAAPVLSVYPGMNMSVLVLALIVVVVGGPGSLSGAVIGSLLIALVQTFGQVFAPALASVAIYAAMAIVLLVRPGGLIPLKGRS